MTASEGLKRAKNRIIAVSNQKGGVGKTTTATSLASALSLLKKKVLLVDCDAQANATSTLGIKSNKLLKTIYHSIIGNCSANECIIPSSIEGLMIMPSSRDLAGLEVELASIEKKEQYLKNCLKDIDHFDYIILDCPPSLGIITINALVASNSVIIPLQCEYLALEGLSYLIQTIRFVKQTYNPNLHIEGILLTMFDQRIKLSFQIATDVRNHFKDIIYRTTIPKNIRLSESPSFGKPIFLYDPKSSGAEAYMAFAQEFLKRNEAKNG